MQAVLGAETPRDTPAGGAENRLRVLPTDPDALLRLARTGDRGAWDAIIALHDRRVVLSLLARKVPLPRARELAHEAWALLFTKNRAGKLDRIELPGLAIAQAWFLAREDARRRGEPERGDAETLLDPRASAEDVLVRREDLRRAERALSKCSPRAQEIFQLVYDEPGLSHADVAARVGISVQRVRQTLCEVRARLRAAMEAPDA